MLTNGSFFKENYFVPNRFLSKQYYMKHSTDMLLFTNIMHGHTLFFINIHHTKGINNKLIKLYIGGAPITRVLTSALMISLSL